MCLRKEPSISTTSVFLVLGALLVLGLNVLLRRPAAPSAPDSRGLLAGARRTRRDHAALVRIGMPALLSLVVIAAALYVILSKGYAAADEKWAFGAVGSILGYWFGQPFKS